MLKRVAPLVLLVALLGTACGTTSANAATVNGHDISAQSVTDELKVIRANSCYEKALADSYGAKLAGASDGTFNTTFVASLLGVRVYYQLLDQRLAADHASPTSEDVQTATKNSDDQINQICKTTHFSSAYKATLVHQEALIEKAQTQAIANFEVACASHIVVSTQAEADSIKKQLDGGADFAALAKQYSLDTDSKDKGGDLGCQPQGTYIAAFDKALFTLPLNKVSDPVKSDAGYHLIIVRERRAGTPADLDSNSAGVLLNRYLFGTMCASSVHVSIDPSYGTWDTSKCKDSSGLATVKPPAKPRTK